MRIILVSHGRLALGMQDTIQFIMGEVPNLTAYAAYVDRNETEYVYGIEAELQQHPEEKFVICTDVLGGSVNTTMIQLLKDYHNVELIAGMNLPLVLQLLAQNDIEDEGSLKHIIQSAQAALVDVNALLVKQQSGEEDDL
jgi:mannose/fructose-specific phosphotransferase system component IIA